MGQGSRGYIGYKKEVTWGEDIGGAATRFLPFISESLTPNIPELMSAAQRGILDEPISYQGEKSFGGDVVVEVHPHSIGHILRSALGAPAAEVLASSTETEFCDCETVWEHNTGVITSLDASDKKKGSYSSKIQVPAGIGDDVILASRIVAIDLKGPPAATSYKFWIKASIATGATDLVFRVSEETLGTTGGSYDDVNVPAMAVPNTWTEMTIAVVDVSDMETTISVALVTGEDLAEIEIHIDDIRAVVVGAATAAWTHVFTPMQTLAQEFAAGAQDTPLWPYTLEVYRDQGLPFAFLGSVVNTMALNFSTTDKILKATCGIIAKNIGVGTAAAVVPETTNPFVWENAIISIGGAGGGAINNNLESFGLTWDNRCVAKYFLNNTAIPGKFIRDGYRTIPVNFVIDFTDRTEYDHFMLGTERQFQIKFVGAEIAADPGFYYTLQIDLPLVRYLAYPINIGGPGRLSCAVTGKAKYSGTHAMQVSLTNEQRTAEYAG